MENTMLSLSYNSLWKLRIDRKLYVVTLCNKEVS